MQRRRARPGPAAHRAATPEPSPALRDLVSGAFAHRRKTLAGSLALSGRGRRHSREQVRAAVERLGHPADARAERLSPEDFRELARLLEP
jgi:16S rRNA (adenine1518-N6/adenine1519-N6)-dimethyltransferase